LKATPILFLSLLSRCTDCFEFFFYNFKLSYYEKSYVEGKFGCKVCSETFFTQHHLKMHVEAKFYACGICSSLFWFEKMLETHLRYMEKNRMIYIPVVTGCLLAVYVNRHLKQGAVNNHHTKSHFKQLNMQFLWESVFCEEDFAATHENPHGDKGYSCKISGKELTSKESI
jgi:hypothetical protein